MPSASTQILLTSDLSHCWSQEVYVSTHVLIYQVVVNYLSI